MSSDYVERHDDGYAVTGSCVSLDSIVYAFVSGESAESIGPSIPVLTLEQVYGAINLLPRGVYPDRNDAFRPQARAHRRRASHQRSAQQLDHVTKCAAVEVLAAASPSMSAVVLASLASDASSPSMIGTLPGATTGCPATSRSACSAAVRRGGLRTVGARAPSAFHLRIEHLPADRSRHGLRGTSSVSYSDVADRAARRRTTNSACPERMSYSTVFCGVLRDVDLVASHDLFMF